LVSWFSFILSYSGLIRSRLLEGAEIRF